jgi:hypothetical protein
VEAVEAANLVALYRATRYHVRLPGGPRCTVCIGRSCPQRLAPLLRRCETFAVISACNPRSRELPVAQNRSRTRALVERVVAQRDRWRPAVGVLGRWREPGLCVFDVPMQRLDALARAFDQNAIVVGGRERRVRLRLYRPDWRDLPGLSGTDDLEWA